MGKAEVSEKQIHFLKKIEAIIPPTSSLTFELSELLGISNDSAYRRMRGETLLSIDEIIALCNSFNISFDAFSKPEGNTVTFSYKGIENGTVGLLNYLQEMHHDLQNIIAVPDANLLYACQDIPVFHHYNFPKLGAFKFFYWMRSIMNSEELENKKFDANLIPKEVFEIAKKIYQLYLKIPSTEIWTLSTIQSTLKQIDFYWESGIFNTKEEALSICDELTEQIELIREQVSVSSKAEDKNEKNYTFYFSEIEINNNCVLINLGHRKAVYLSHFSFYTMKTMNEEYALKTEHWLNSMIQKTTLISGVSEKIRFKFFNTLQKEINQLKSKIENE